MATASSVSRGMKSGVQPCIRWGRKLGWLPAGEPSAARSCASPLARSGELSGSHTTIFVFGLRSFSTRDTPLRVPPVP